MSSVAIQLIKCLHVLTAAGLLGTLIFCLVPHTEKTHTLNRPSYFSLKQGLLGATLLAALTGILLVYPRHFTFQTPWIQAALLGTTVTFTALFLFFPSTISDTTKRRRLLCIVLISLLSVIVHDAVTKQTFLLKNTHPAKSEAIKLK